MPARPRSTSTSAALLGVALAAAAAGCALPPDPGVPPRRGSAPLIGGTVTGDDPAVVALASGSNPDRAFCTGTLVSPSVVLTAAHCVDMLGNDPNAIVFFGADASADGVRIGIKDAQQHLGWTGQVGAFDVALVTMNFPADPFIAVPLNTAALEDLVGEPYRHVGFGVFDRATGAADGKKRTGTVVIDGLVAPDVVRSGDAAVSVCFGDSGGPGLVTIDGVEAVAGIHSYTTGQACDPPNGDTRVDRYAADFIGPYVDANDPACGADGTCAPIGCTDDPDCEPCGRDGTCTDGCALPDPDCPTGALGDICQADSQCESGLCVFWRGDLEYRFCSTACEVGDACGDGMSCQNVMPFGDVCYFDEPPPGVLGDACEEAVDCGSYQCDDGACVYLCDLSQGLGCPPDFACQASEGGAYHCRALASDDGGCGCGAASPGSSLGGVLLAALGLAGSRRRRRRR